MYLSVNFFKNLMKIKKFSKISLQIADWMNMTIMHPSVVVNAANKWCLNEFGESFEAPVTELKYLPRTSAVTNNPNQKFITLVHWLKSPKLVWHEFTSVESSHLYYKEESDKFWWLQQASWLHYWPSWLAVDSQLSYLL